MPSTLSVTETDVNKLKKKKRHSPGPADIGRENHNKNCDKINVVVSLFEDNGNINGEEQTLRTLEKSSLGTGTACPHSQITPLQ